MDWNGFASDFYTNELYHFLRSHFYLKYYQDLQIIDLIEVQLSRYLGLIQ